MKHMNCLMLFLVLLSYFGHSNSRILDVQNGKPIIIGHMTDGEMDSNVARVIINSAVENLYNSFILPRSIRFNHIVINKKCSVMNAITSGDKYHSKKQSVDVWLGPPCTAGMQQLGMLTTVWKDITLGYVNIGKKLRNKNVYKYLTRFHPSQDQLVTALVGVMKQFNWRQVAILKLRGLPDCGDVNAALNLLKNSPDVQFNYQGIITRAMTNFSTVLNELRRKARVVFMCNGFKDANSPNVPGARDILLQAASLGMVTPEFVYFLLQPGNHYGNSPSWKIQSSIGYDPLLNKARNAFKSAVIVKPEGASETNFIQLDELLQRELNVSVDELNYVGVNGKNARYIFPMPYMYDSIYMYGLALNNSLEPNTQAIDISGPALIKYFKCGAFDGYSGRVALDQLADRIPSYSLFRFDEHGSYSEMALLEGYFINCSSSVDKIQFRYAPIRPPSWGTPKNVAPPDEPMRHDDEKELLFGGAWRILATELLLIDTAMTNMSRSMLSVRSIQSKLATSMISMDPTSKSPKLRTYIDHPFQEDISDDLTAIYQGSERVKLKVLRKSVKTEIKFDRDQLIMLKSLRNLNQDNLCAFFGVCTDHDKVVAFVWKSEDRGSLEDLIFSHDINLDSVFKTSLTVDVLKLFHAVEFLHRSPIEYHGQLSACSCMVSSRWVVKLQNFGEHRLTQYMTDKKQLQGSKTPEPKSFFHMAPEILTHVVANEQPNLSVELLQSADEMWDADARARPTAARARSRFSSQMKKYMTSMMDHMITMMEKYTNNLEILVKERTIQVEEEHRRSEELLCQLLPPSIAQDLKKGVAIVPENYESATIFFSDVVGFTTTCSTSTPFQVVTMINSLFSLIDDVISKYDVYKVETIGDCYLIASGLPIRNGDKHVVEIGTMACAMRLAIGSYVVPHLPEKKLQMRFGIHTGHVAAGVVGSMMPRYCLFGDTVNVASRMESNGERKTVSPVQIHISEQTKNFIQKYEYPIFRLTYRGEIQIKGKGLQRTYWLDSLLD